MVSKKTLTLLPLFCLLVVAVIFVSRLAERQSQAPDTTLSSLTDVYREHYHSTEEHNGHVYVIRRSSGDNWTDTLWRYDGTGNGKMLYSERGLDFRVSDDERYAAVFNVDGVDVINLDEHTTKTLTFKDLGIDQELGPYPFRWNGHEIWFGANRAIELVHLFSVDASSMKVQQSVDLNALSMTIGETSLNPEAELIAFSDYVQVFTDGEVAECPLGFSTLNVYNLSTKDVVVIEKAQSCRAFHPDWLDGSTLEYDVSADGVRATYQVK